MSRVLLFIGVDGCNLGSVRDNIGDSDAVCRGEMGQGLAQQLNLPGGSVRGGGSARRELERATRRGFV